MHFKGSGLCADLVLILQLLLLLRLLPLLLSPALRLGLGPLAVDIKMRVGSRSRFYHEG